MKWIFCAILASGLLRPGMKPAEADNYLIVPGQSIGTVKIGARRTTVLKQKGKPDSTVWVRKHWRQDSWTHRGMINGGDEMTLFTRVLYHYRRVVQIETNEPKFATKENISTDIGNGPATQRETYKELRWSVYRSKRRGTDIYYHEGVKRGLSFLYVQKGLKGGTLVSGVEHALVVHRKGVRPFRMPGSRFVRRTAAIFPWDTKKFS